MWAGLVVTYARMHGKMATKASAKEKKEGQSALGLGKAYLLLYNALLTAGYVLVVS